MQAAHYPQQPGQMQAGQMPGPAAAGGSAIAPQQMGQLGVAPPPASGMTGMGMPPGESRCQPAADQAGRGRAGQTVDAVVSGDWVRERVGFRKKRVDVELVGCAFRSYESRMRGLRATGWLAHCLFMLEAASP